MIKVIIIMIMRMTMVQMLAGEDGLVFGDDDIDCDDDINCDDDIDIW